MGDMTLKVVMSAYLGELASDSPTPGGGSAAALSAALGAATGRMAASFTLGRKKYAAVQEAVARLEGRLARSQAMAEQLVVEDMTAFEALQTANSRGAQVDQAEKAAVIAGVVAVPMQVAGVAGAILGDLDALKDMANPFLLSDVAVGAELAMASARAAAVNVRVNLSGLSAEEAARVAGQLEETIGHARVHYESVLAYTNREIGGG